MMTHQVSEVTHRVRLHPQVLWRWIHRTSVARGPSGPVSPWSSPSIPSSSHRDHSWTSCPNSGWWHFVVNHSTSITRCEKKNLRISTILAVWRRVEETLLEHNTANGGVPETYEVSAEHDYIYMESVLLLPIYDIVRAIIQFLVLYWLCHVMLVGTGQLTSNY